MGLQFSTGARAADSLQRSGIDGSAAVIRHSTRFRVGLLAVHLYTAELSHMIAQTTCVSISMPMRARYASALRLMMKHKQFRNSPSVSGPLVTGCRLAG